VKENHNYDDDDDLFDDDLLIDISQVEIPLKSNGTNIITQKRPTLNSKNSIEKRPRKEQPAPYTYFVDHLNNRPAFGSTTFKVKAALTEVIPPFKYRTGTYILKVRLDDGTSSPIVSLSDHVIEKLMGISCAELCENVGTKAGDDENKRYLQKMESTLFSLEGLMTISLSSNPEEPPVVIEIAPMTKNEAQDMLEHVNFSLF